MWSRVKTTDVTEVKKQITRDAETKEKKVKRESVKINCSVVANSLSFFCFLLGFSVSCAETARVRQRTPYRKRGRGREGAIQFLLLSHSLYCHYPLFACHNYNWLVVTQTITLSLLHPWSTLDLPLALVSYLLFACDFTLQWLLN